MAKATFNPWEVKGEVNYDKLIKEFGIKPLGDLPRIFLDEVLFRRKVVFAHRDFEIILKCIKEKKPFVMMTGLMPSGPFHLGHMILARQMAFYQKLGAKIYIAVADLEAYNTRQKDLNELRRVAIDQYLLNYAALGLDLSACDIYFQSDRSKDAEKSNAYYRLANAFSRYATFNEFKGVYGDISPGKMASSLLQASDMYHPQLPEFEKGPAPTFIPVGIDQDPHIRIARGMASKNKDYKFIPIASTYHYFMPGLNGGKMSSSEENSYIALTDDDKTVKRKINKYAFSGGRDTVEEHRKKGGRADIDVSFQYLKMFFESDDEKLEQIRKDYESGKILSGELKDYLIRKINAFLEDVQKKRNRYKEQVIKMFE